jgi:WD40 repeat protein
VGSGSSQADVVARRHDGPVHALAWAHPSFGSILASCSFDGKVFIWKENDGPQKGWSKVKEHLLHTASGTFGSSTAPFTIVALLGV